MLSASANKLSKLKDQAAEYAALIMEGLHVDGAEYITVTTCDFLSANLRILRWLRCDGIGY